MVCRCQAVRFRIADGAVLPEERSLSFRGDPRLILWASWVRVRAVDLVWSQRVQVT